jgi:beta-lactamase regulating signal transducer with metallopeptidase domain
MMVLLFVAEWALRSSVLICIGALVLWAVRVKSPSVRLAVCTGMLCASLAVPALTLVLPGLPLTRPRPAALAPQVQIALDHAPSTSISTLQVPRPEEKSWWMRLNAPRVAVTVYILVAAILLLRLCIGIMLGQRVLRASRPTGRMADGIEVRESGRVSVPVTLGIVRPAIVLPSDWTEWPQVKLEAVLAHERSHARRMDPLLQAASAIHRALLWLTPLSWFLHRRIVRVAEEVSDEAALAVCARASYADILLGFIRGGVPIVAWQGVAMARYGHPEERIRRILNGTALSRRLTLGSILAIVALISTLTYVVAAAGPQHASNPSAMIAPQGLAHRVTQSAALVPSAARIHVALATKRASAATADPPSPTQAATVPQTATSAIRRYVIVHGNSTSGSWDSDNPDLERLREQFGENFAWFRHDGHEYVVTDAAVMAELEKAMEPQKNVSRMQARVNGEQARVNGLQSKVNAHQAGVNALQGEVNRRQDLANQMQNVVNHGGDAALLQKLEAQLRELRTSNVDTNQADVNRRQSQVNAEQADVNAEQAKVNVLQSKVNDEQHRVSAEFNQRVQEIFNSALQHGSVRQLN